MDKSKRTDCRQTYAELAARGVEFTKGPERRPFGLQAVFKDLYGNTDALVKPGGGGA